jgi:DNA-binding NarL/FixJ family response regulator
MKNECPPRVWLVDEDHHVRHALTLLLTTVMGMQVVGGTSDIAGVYAQGHDHQLDLVLIDWTIIAANAPRVIAQLHTCTRHLCVVVLSTRMDVRELALAAGADAFISKIDSSDQVMATLRRVLPADSSST